MDCNTNLPNWGTGDCKLKMTEIRRVMFVSKTKEDGSENFISQADAAAIANWQLLFNKYNFLSDILEKVVPSTWIFKFANEQADPPVYDEDGDYEKLRDGDYTLSFEIHKMVADFIRAFKELEGKTLCAYFVDSGNRVWGRKSGVNLYPVELDGQYIQNFNFKTSETISSEMFRARVKYPTQMNTLIEVAVADGDVTSDNDFFSLIDADNTISSPAITGCTAVIDTARYDEAVVGALFGAFNFVDQDGVSPDVPAVSSVETPNGTYAIACTLVTGHTYDLHASYSGYDIAVGEVVVP